MTDDRTTALLEDARARPAWARLVRELLGVLPLQERAEELDEQHASYVERAPLPQPTLERQDDAPGYALDLPGLEVERDVAHEALTTALRTSEHRARLLAGQVAPKDYTPEDRRALASVLFEAARSDAHARQERQGGNEAQQLRLARHTARLAQHTRPAEAAPDVPPTFRPRAVDITQTQRVEINLVAAAIHRRYLVPGHLLGAASPAFQVARKIITMALRDVGGSDAPVGEAAQPKPHPVAQSLRENARQAYGDALQACEYLLLGDVDQARAYAERARAHRAHYLLASRELEKTTKRIATGRFFGGEIWSVRQYVQAEGEDRGKDRPFWQRYFRLVVLYAEDGCSLTIANGQALEGITGVDVGEDGWADLARWIEDNTDRQDGKRRGRRVDDTAHLVYRQRSEDDERLELRKSVRDQYPGLVRALECLRRAMYTPDVLVEEIPEGRPAPGFNVPEPDDDEGEEDLEGEDLVEDHERDL